MNPTQTQTQALSDLLGQSWSEQLRAATGEAASRRLLAEQAEAMAPLRLAYDNDGLWDWGAPDGDGPVLLRQTVDHYVHAGATFLAWGAGGNTAWNFRPRRMQAIWRTEGASGWVERAPGLSTCVERMRAYEAADSDPLAVILDHARGRLPVLAGFRFNRYHLEHDPPLADRWFLAHPEAHLPASSCPFVQATSNPWPAEARIDLGRAEVREHLAADLLDVVEHYPVDGLHLEWMRAVPFVEIGTADGAAHVTDFLRRLRAGLDRIGAERGRRLRLSLWLPSAQHMRALRPMWPDRFFGDEAWGLAVETWIEEGLVDTLMPSLWSQDLGMSEPVPLLGWVETARARGIEVHGCLMNLTPLADAADVGRAVDVMRAVGDACDGVFLFNTQPLHVAAMLAAASPAPQGTYPQAQHDDLDPPGIVFLDPHQVYQFASRPARRIQVGVPPAGKPYVISLANGDLLTAYTARYIADLARSQEEGYWTEVRWSSDGGETWSEPVRPYPPDFIPWSKEATLVQLADGRVLCLVHGVRPDDHYVTPLLTLSEDGGRSWSVPWRLDVSPMFPTGHALSNRSHIPLDDGSVILFFTDFSVEPYRTWACRSRDGGRSFEDHWHVGDDIGDQSFVRLPSGRFLAAVRVYGEIMEDKSQLPYGEHPAWAAGLGGGEAHDFIAITDSDDGGRSWSPRRPLLYYGEVPSQLLVVDDGRVLLTYGVRHYPMGAQAVLSADDGATWDLDRRMMLAWHGAPYCGSLPDWGHAYPNGHPYSAQRADGRIVTLYYRTMDPRRYDSTVIEAVIWDLPPAPTEETS